MLTGLQLVYEALLAARTADHIRFPLSVVVVVPIYVSSHLSLWIPIVSVISVMAYVVIVVSIYVFAVWAFHKSLIVRWYLVALALITLSGGASLIVLCDYSRIVLKVPHHHRLVA